MARINILPKNIADLIAAGEVVERPSSVVKEFVENSIDAGAKKIVIEIKNGGKTYLRVTDDGCGIHRDDVKKAFISHATSKSLIVFDEIGRGTSTYDGMSIARAVLEYTADKKQIGAKTLFATHYHELTELEESIEGVNNYNTSVKKRGDDITFLRRIVKGPADGSYGVEVAKLAGVPKTVVENAKKILKSLESQIPVKVVKKQGVADEPEELQLSFTSGGKDNIIDKLKNIDVNTLTPIEAMTVLFELQKDANNL